MDAQDIKNYADSIVEWLDTLMLYGKSGYISARVQTRVKTEFRASINNALFVNYSYARMPRLKTFRKNYYEFTENDFRAQFICLTNIADKISKKFSSPIPEKIKFMQLMYRI